MLDFSTWVEKRPNKTKQWVLENRLRMRFYEKPCTSKLVMEEGSAMPRKIEIVTLSNEIIRRMRTTDKDATMEDRAEILTKFLRKLWRSGYTEKDRRNILESGVRGYLQMRKNEKDGGRRVNRKQKEGKRAREIKKVIGKATWQLKRPNGEAGGNNINPPAGRMVGTPAQTRGQRKEHENEQNIEAVVFVPITPGSKLQRALQALDDRFSRLHRIGRWRYVERSGTKVKDSLGKTNPWGGSVPKEELLAL